MPLELRQSRDSTGISNIMTRFSHSCAIVWEQADCRNPPKFYAELYRTNGLTGGHVIKLGPGNDDAAREALAAWPNGLQVGGGINAGNAQEWLDAGAEKVCTDSGLTRRCKPQDSQLFLRRAKLTIRSS